MDKIEVRRDHLMYLIHELNAVRRDKQDLAERVDHVHSCLCAMAGMDALKDGRIDRYVMAYEVNVNAQADAKGLASAVESIVDRWYKNNTRIGGPVTTPR